MARFHFEIMHFAEFNQAFVTLGGVDTAGPPDFGLALRAEFERPTVGLGEVVRAVHAALERNAVRDTQHVPGFMCGRGECSPQAQRV